MSGAATRRLAAIVAADVVGFSRLMGQDEEGTHRRVKALRTSIIEPHLAKHSGRLVKTTGDGFLIEFASVIGAVRFATNVQEAIVQSEQPGSPDAISLRVGINVGEVIADDDGDLFGDGVNVAARLEQICPPGGICVSERAWRDLRQLSLNFIDIGPQSLKNIKDPIRAYVIAPDGWSAPAREIGAPHPHNRKLRFGVAATILTLIAALLIWGTSDDPERSSKVSLTIKPVSAASHGIEGLAIQSQESMQAFLSTMPNISLITRSSWSGDADSYNLKTKIQELKDEIRFTFELTNENTGGLIFTRSINRPSSERSLLPDQMAILARRIFRCTLDGPAINEAPVPDRALSLYANMCADSLDHTLGPVRLLAFARQMTQIAPDFGIAWSARGNYAAALATKDNAGSRDEFAKEAVSSLAKSESINPENSEIYLAKEKLVPREDRRRREALFKRAINSNLVYGGYEYIYYGRFLSEIGNKSGAIAQFQAAYDLNPLDPYVGPILVTALAEAGRGAEAARLDKSLRKLWPTDLEV